MDIKLVRRMAARATERCKEDFEEIEKGLSPCFKTGNPSRKLTKTRCDELRRILDRLAEEERTAFPR